MPNRIISHVDVHVLQLDFKKPIVSALGTYKGSDYVVVEIKTSEGISGFGYSMSLDRRGTTAVVNYITEDLLPLIENQNMTEPELLWYKMWSPNKARMRGGVGVHALSAVDTAIWDATAKMNGKSLNEMLGGFRQKVPVYGSGGWLSMSDLELISEAQNHADKGIKAYKYKIGGERDKKRTKLLRDEMGEKFTLYADANQSFDVAKSIETSKWLTEFDVAWLEEPVLADCPWELERVAEQSAIPIAAGENVYFEWGFLDLCSRKAASYLQPDIGRCGGVTEWVKIVKLAEKNNLKLTSHLLHEVSASLIGASPCGESVEFMNFFEDQPFTHDFSIKNGYITVPDTLGHGVQFSDSARRKYSI